jgi:DNA polymerase-3 subunit delta'
LYKNYSVQFKEIIGHSSLKNKLLNIAQSGRISHTQLFLGPEGSGNLALALAFAQYVNCTQPGTEDSCGNCSSCIKYQQIIHPDLHFTYPFTSPTKLSKELIEEWRAAIIDNPYISDFDWLQKINNEANKQLNITAEECRAVISGLGLKSYEAKYKVHVIWQPEYLSKEGNILLKLLEEPPPFTLILLVGNNTEKILPTILSRAQLVKVPKITDADLIDALIAKYSMEEQKARDTARLADGNFNRAKSLIDIDHEVGDLSEYTSTVEDSGDLSAHADAALAGTRFAPAPGETFGSAAGRGRDSVTWFQGDTRLFWSRRTSLVSRHVC